MRFKCWLFGHDWVYSPHGGRRACRRCHRREYRSESGVRGFGRLEKYEVWDEHTYPLDADPRNDPSPIYIDGYSYTLGTMKVLDDVFREVLK